VTVPLEPEEGAREARAVVDSVLGRRGRTERDERLTALRHGAAAAGAVPDPGIERLGDAAELVDKVAREAYRVTDEDVESVRGARRSEEEVFDLVVATAVGAGLARRAIGRAAVDRWEARR
jgi:hypothetical protein